MRGNGPEVLLVLFLLIFLYMAFLLAGRMMGRHSNRPESEVGWEYSTELDVSSP